MPAKYAINPDRNQPWNALPLLPVDGSLYLTNDTLRQLADAKHALGKLQGRSIVIPNPGMLVNTISLQEAKASSEIENIFTTDDELYQAFSKSMDDSVEGPTKEVLRYREALWAGWNELQEGKQLDTEFMRKVFREVQATSEDIRPDFSRTYIKQGGSGPNAGKPVYTPPRGKQLLRDKLENLWEFLNNDEQYAIDPLLKMAIGHFQFEAIHPFRDGNGRTGRIINLLYLSKQGLLEYPILYMSRYILQHKADYYEHLANVSQRGKWEPWVQFMLKTVESTANYTYQQINRIMEARTAILEEITQHTNFQRPEQLVEVLFYQPYTVVKHLTDRGIYAENTARKYLEKLVEMEILEKKKIQGYHYYLNLELYHILAE